MRAAAGFVAVPLLRRLYGRRLGAGARVDAQPAQAMYKRAVRYLGIVSRGPVERRGQIWRGSL